MPFQATKNLYLAISTLSNVYTLMFVHFCIEYESPASTARTPQQQQQIQSQPQQIQQQFNIQQQLNYSPTIEEMERSLGIGTKYLNTFL